MQEEKPDTLTRYQLGGKVDLCGKWMSCVHYKQSLNLVMAAVLLLQL